MLSKIVFSIVLTIFVSSSVLADCNNPVITSTSFTTQDATIVSQIAYVSEFTLKCPNDERVSLFAEVEGKLSPVAQVGQNKYQVVF